MLDSVEKSRRRAATNNSMQRSNPSSTESTKQNVGDDGYPSPQGIPLSDTYAAEELSGRGYIGDPSDPEGVQFPEGPDIYRNTPSSTVKPIFFQEPLEAPKVFSSGRPEAVSNGKVVSTNEYFRHRLSSPRQQSLYNPDTDITTVSQPVIMSGQTNKYDRRTHLFHNQNSPGDIVRIYDLAPTAHQPLESRRYPSTAHSVDNQLKQEPDASDELEPKLLLQPETKAISHDQLVTEVRGIYAGLVMVEAKCIDVDEKQLSAALDKHSRSRLNPEQWQALIALHKTLLHEHHDFFLASQHPSASSALSHLAAKYSMPARMWKHGIHAFLEVLRHRLPESLDHMLAFIYIAYSMMALLFETVPTFEDTWIECLGDIARYRMAIEDDDIRDREVWSGVARFWYGKAADKNPNTGRLYHHLAILARPFTVMQLSLYLRAITCIIFFDNAKSSIRTLFDPILRGEESSYYRISSVETMFIKAHALLFTGQSPREYRNIVDQLLSGALDVYIGKITSKFKEHGACMAIANAASLFEYGVTRDKQDSRSIFRLSYQDYLPRVAQTNEVKSEKSQDTGHTEPASLQLSKEEYTSSTQLIALASILTFGTFTVALRRMGDKNVYPLVHIYLVLIRSLINVPKAFKLIEMDIQWIDLGTFLTTLARSVIINPRKLGPKFPEPEQTAGRPLFEDFLMRGQLWSELYFPPSWFHECNVDDEERSLELASMTAERTERILWLAMLIVEVRLVNPLTCLYTSTPILIICSLGPI